MAVTVRRCGALAAAAVALLVAKAWLYLDPGRAVRWGSLVDPRNPRPGEGVSDRRDPRPVIDPRSAETIHDFSAAVTAIGRRRPFSATCLEQSLALVMLLARVRMPAHLVLGVSRAAPALRAHAWVECGGAVVHGGGAHAAGFAPLVRPLPPASSSPVPSSCPG